jgi:hypothetical protein
MIIIMSISISLFHHYCCAFFASYGCGELKLRMYMLSNKKGSISNRVGEDDLKVSWHSWSTMVKKKGGM